MLSNVLGVFFFSSKSAKFLHVASDSLEKHCPAFFSPDYPYLQEKTYAKNPSATFAFLC